MKVWITKYALTKGIFETDVEVCREINPDMVKQTGIQWPQYFHKPHWHESWGDAAAQAERMRQAKLKSLKKQIAKLEAMRFEEPEQS